MKAILITVLGSFLALSVSAQTTTETKPTVASEPAKLSTGTKIMTARPAKVADSTAPVQMQQANQPDAVSPATPPAGVLREEKVVNPNATPLSKGRRTTSVAKDDAAGQPK